ncbi:hypothetical protein AYI69_g2513 [Smittium culicis]|uniref:Uncharacterized protein n=1 Tax=Smittium culicis TaxID=133412 RepID=A0A1R1Y3R4_9FUNG|nr:hypothetical protein AYI69_g5776 [Smittium culicis]OMJ28030.1 hypothetical protein AYI69_g2513 [Smittium culicis]
MKLSTLSLTIIGSFVMNTLSMNYSNENNDSLLLKRDSVIHGNLSRNGHRNYRGYKYGGRLWFWRNRPGSIFISSLKYTPRNFCDQRFEYLYMYFPDFRRSWNRDMVFRRKWERSIKFRRFWFRRVNYKSWIQ